MPERRILHPGDLFIWAVPNAGNPQKVQRYAGDWAAALREMAGLGAELLLAGHGLPIFGADRIRQALTETAELLESIEEQTLALMNGGCSLDRVLHEVEVPAHLRDRPYLRPVYDHPQFIVRNVWRRFGGWYDGEPDHLLPAPRAQQAREWVGAGRRARPGARPGAGAGRRRGPADGLPPGRARRARRARLGRGPRAAGRGLRGAGRRSRSRRWPATSSATPPISSEEGRIDLAGHV